MSSYPNLEDSQAYLQNVADPSSPILLRLDVQPFSLPEAQEMIPQAQSIPADLLPPVLARTMALLVSTNKLDEWLVSSQLCLLLWSNPLATATGCLSYAPLSAYHFYVNSKITTALRESGEKGFSITSLDDVIDSEENTLTNDINLNSVSDDESVLTSSSGRPVRSTRRGSASTAASSTSGLKSMSYTVLKDFLSTLKTHIQATVCSCQDEELLNSFSELLWKILFLTILHKDFANLKNTTIKIISKFGTYSLNSCLALNRTIIPIITLNFSRNFFIPDVQKLKKLCFSATIQAYQNFIEDAFVLTVIPDRKTIVSTNFEEDEFEMDIDNSNELNEAQSRYNSTKQQQKATSGENFFTNIDSSLQLPPAYLSALALLQRMLVGVPDRAPARATIATAVENILTTIVELVKKMKDKKNNISTFTCHNSLLLLKHFINFLFKLSKSNKVNFRVTSLEICCELLLAPWFWEFNLSEKEENSEGEEKDEACEDSIEEKSALGRAIVLLIIQRCEDVSNVVRMKAISTIFDLIVSYSYNSSLNMISTFYFILFNNPKENNKLASNSNSINIFDILKILAQDSKSSIRSKSVQTYALILTKTWWKCVININSDKSEEEETKYSKVQISMHLNEDDILVLTTATRDASVLVRKTAVASFSQLLISVPHNIFVLEHWINSCLPLILDSESTVCLKLSESLQDILFQSLIDWKILMNKNKKIEHNSENHFELLGWRLINLTKEFDLIHLLKQIIGNLLKQGAFNFTNKPSYNKASFSMILQTLKQACSLINEQDDSLNNSTESIMNYSLLQEITSASWILLELIVSHTNTLVIDANTTSQSGSVKLSHHLSKFGSIDFAVDFYKLRKKEYEMKKSYKLQYDEIDIIVLRVIEKLSSNLSPNHINFLLNEADKILENLPLDSELIAVCVSLRFQLTHVKYLGSSSSTSSNNQNHTVPKVTKSELQDRDVDLSNWASKLALNIHYLLHSFAFLEPPSHNFSNLIFLGYHKVSKQIEQYYSDLDCTQSTISAITNDTSTLSNPVNEEENIIQSINSSIFLLGELAMLGFKIEEIDISKAKSNSGVINQDELFLTKGKIDYYSNLADISSFRFFFPPCVISLIQLFMSKIIPYKSKKQGDESQMDEDSSRLCPPNIRAISFLTLGKFCLRNQVLARENINIYLREINSDYNYNDEPSSKSPHSSTIISKNVKDTFNHASVRNNALLVLGDLCVRHTHLVDRHIDHLSTCLQDQDKNIRKNTLLLLTQLLVQDFVKWKGLLLYRFLLLTIDKEPEIATFAKDILTRTLSIKYPGIIHQHFSEAFIIFNKCVNHPIFSAIAWNNNNEQEDASTTPSPTLDPFTQSFNSNTPMLSRTQRFMIYEFMIQSLSDELKIHIMAKLVSDILASAIDNAKTLLPNRSRVGSNSSLTLTPFEKAVEDVLVFLRSPSLKIGNKKPNSNSNEEEIDGGEENTSASSAIAAAKTKILKTLSSQHLVNHLLPVLMSLKHTLESIKSPLQGTLMDYLIILLKNHKNEVTQVLLSDPTLKAELEYDLKKYEKSKLESLQTKEQEAVLFSPYLDVQPSAIKKPNLKGQSSVKGKTPLTNRRVSFHKDISEMQQAINEDDHIDRLTAPSQPSNQDGPASPFNSPQKPRDPHSLTMSGKRLSWSVVVNTKVDEFAVDNKTSSPQEEDEEDDDDPIQYLVRQSLGGSSTPIKNNINNNEEMKSWIDEPSTKPTQKLHRSSLSNSLLDTLKSNNLDSTFEALSTEQSIEEHSNEEPKLKKKRLAGYKDSLSSLL